MPTEVERVRVFTAKWKITVCYIVVAVSVGTAADLIVLVRGW